VDKGVHKGVQRHAFNRSSDHVVFQTQDSGLAFEKGGVVNLLVLVLVLVLVLFLFFVLVLLVLVLGLGLGHIAKEKRKKKGEGEKTHIV
jgi:hypothetical protein